MPIFKQAFLLVNVLLALNKWSLQAQTGDLIGKLQDEKGQSRAGEVFLVELSQKKVVGSDGSFRFEGLAYGVYTLTCYVSGLQSQSQTIRLDQPEVMVLLTMREFSQNLRTIEVEGQAPETSALTAQRLYAVEGVGIYEAKKNEVIILNNIASNEATNNARQIFGRVPGLNIWESDAAGLQLDIAARGLSPGRTANFNTRLNGYDMSADALGYPESYYTPPMQAVERIEIVRGAASLQYGPQFGGMINFVLKEAPQDKKISGELDLAGGSYGFFNAFGSVSGTLGKWHYSSYYQYKRNEGWRPNSGFDLHSAFVRLGYRPTEALDFRVEYASLYYLAQQPGGLTDAFFAQDPRQSQRARNWFKVNWNLFAFLVDYRLSERTRLNFRQFWLLSGREALGNLERITVADLGDNRTLIRDRYRNFGQETRLLHRYSLGAQAAALLLGFRYYQGFTLKQQGDANATAAPDFAFLNPNDLENSDFDFPSRNYAFFAENVFNLSPRFSLTPGIRIEHLRTRSEGTYKVESTDQAGNIVGEARFFEQTGVFRSFVLLGLGLSYKPSENWEWYGNFSQNFRSITFSDLRIDNPNYQLDSLIKDEQGYNLDLGARGQWAERLNFDISAFYLRYNDRIGFLVLANQPPLFLDYRFQTNVGDSRHYGIEAFAELETGDWLFGKKSGLKLAWFVNFSWTEAQYVNSQKPEIIGKRVENAPRLMLRGGFNLKWKKLLLTGQASSVSEQYTDATNSPRTPTAVGGIIPAYVVADLSVQYQGNWWRASLSVNNVTDTRYFTRRAESYPGPGIIPANPRTFYMSLGLMF